MRKWDAYYAALSPIEPPEVARFGEEFREAVEEILPVGGRVIETGCGAGWQSLALARSGRYEINLLDFSEQALAFARNVFERAGQHAEFLCGDLFEHSETEYDLVFNSGVIEHYPFRQQVEMLRAMASRSRRYVVVLAPNSQCYWYWISRIRNASRANWPFGIEVPVGRLREVFESAGLIFHGQRYLGRSWTESFIRNLPEIGDDLRELIVEIHSGLVPAEHASYLVAALGSVHTDSGWRDEAGGVDSNVAQLRAITADALSVRVAAEGELTRSAARIRELEEEVRERDELREQVRALEAAIELAEKESARAREQVQNLERLTGEQCDELRQLQAAFNALESEMARREQAIQSMETARATLERERAQLLESRANLAQQVAEMSAGAVLFQEALDERLSQYRSQRAWQLMLAIRKAYTLAVRGGWADRLRLLGWAGPDIQSFDLQFPNIRDFLPLSPSVTLPGVAMQPPARKYDVIVLAIIDFDFRFQRPQQIAVQYARAGHRVFWVSPTRFLPPNGDKPYVTVPLRDRIWEVRLRGTPTDVYRNELSEESATGFHEGIQALCGDWALPEVCLLVQLPFWRRLALQLRSSQLAVLVYDCMDDWEAFQNIGRFNVEEETRLAQEADLLVVTARALENKFADQGLRPLLVRNGVDFLFFESAPRHPETARYVRPIIGYFGAIADWIDLDLIAEVAAARPSYTFVLIGEVFDRDMSRLEQLGNVALLGSKSYSEIPSYLRDFDVCIIPFVLNAVTHATDPVKLYEYLSHGKPVVATDMAELRHLSDMVYLARGTAEFAEKLDAAVTECDGGLREKRIAFAAANTWHDRVQLLDAAVQEKFPLVSILIVTHNSREYMRPLVESLRRNTTYPRWEVLIVDNASEDGTGELLRELTSGDGRFRHWMMQENRGFASANNFAAREARGEYLVFLNADTIVSPGWLGRLLRHTRPQDAGLVAAVTNFAGNEVKIDVPYRNLAEMEEFAIRLACERAGQSLEIAVAPLFCAAVRRETWDKVGELDEQFSVGMFEDDDFSLRIARAGYRVLAAEDCFVHHFGQGSFAKLAPERYEQVFRENKARFERKWSQSWQAHKLRAGTRPPLEDRRLSVGEMCGSPSAQDPPLPGSEDEATPRHTE